MHPPVPVVRAAARVHAELLARAVDLPFQIAILQLGNRVGPRALEEQIGNEEAAEMRRVGDTARASDGSVKRDRAHDEDEVLCGDWKQEIQIDRSVREAEPVSQ